MSSLARSAGVPKVLIAHGNTQHLRRAVAELQQLGCSVVATPDGGDAFARFFELQPDLVISHVGLPSLSGINFTRMVLSQSPDTAVVLLADGALTDVPTGVIVLSDPLQLDHLIAALPQLGLGSMLEANDPGNAPCDDSTQVFTHAALQRFRRDNHLLALLDAAGLERLAACAQHRLCHDGERLIREGEIGDGCFFIVEGQVRVTLREKQDAEVARISAGGFFGEIALLNAQPRSASVWSVGETTLLSFSRKDFMPLLELYPIIREVLSGVALRRTEANLWRVLFDDEEVRRRFDRLEKDAPEFGHKGEASPDGNESSGPDHDPAKGARISRNSDHSNEEPPNGASPATPLPTSPDMPEVGDEIGVDVEEEFEVEIEVQDQFEVEDQVEVEVRNKNEFEGEGGVEIQVEDQVEIRNKEEFEGEGGVEVEVDAGADVDLDVAFQNEDTAHLDTGVHVDLDGESKGTAGGGEKQAVADLTIGAGPPTGAGEAEHPPERRRLSNPASLSGVIVGFAIGIGCGFALATWTAGRSAIPVFPPPVVVEPASTTTTGQPDGLDHGLAATEVAATAWNADHSTSDETGEQSSDETDDRLRDESPDEVGAETNDTQPALTSGSPTEGPPAAEGLVPTGAETTEMAEEATARPASAATAFTIDPADDDAGLESSGKAAAAIRSAAPIVAHTEAQLAERKLLRRGLFRAHQRAAYREAAALGRRLVQRYVVDWEAEFLVAECERQAGQPGAALRRYSRFYRQYPRSSAADAATYWAAEILTQQGRRSEAEQLYQRLVRRGSTKYRQLAQQRLKPVPPTPVEAETAPP